MSIVAFGFTHSCPKMNRHTKFMLYCISIVSANIIFVVSVLTILIVHLYITSRGTRWGKIISVSDLELYEI